MIEIRDIAWLAGLMEGEGSFSTYRKRHRQDGHKRVAQLTLMMTDEDVVAKAAQLMGTRVYGPYGPYRGCTKQCWQVHMSGKRAIAWMFTLYPLMGKRRREAIERAVAEWKTFR